MLSPDGPQQVLQSTRNRIGVDMVNLSDAVKLLRAQRKELSDQLDAVDKALAALGEPRGVTRTGSEGNSQVAARETVTEVLPTRLKPSRKLSDEHRHALKEGRRKARRDLSTRNRRSENHRLQRQPFHPRWL